MIESCTNQYQTIYSLLVDLCKKTTEVCRKLRSSKIKITIILFIYESVDIFSQNPKSITSIIFMFNERKYDIVYISILYILFVVFYLISVPLST